MLFKYHNSSDAPEHVTLSLDAVSLAFMAHNTASPSAADLGRRKYVSALRKINTELQHAESAKKASTFEGALLLDLYEKMTKSATAFNTGRNAHVEGALALVKLRGVEDFKDESEVKSMLGLSLNATVCSLAAGQRIPAQVRAIRAHVGQFVDITDPKWRLSDAMLEMADLTADVRANRLTKEEKITRCIELDSLLGDIAHEGHPEWRRKRIIIPYEYRAGTLPEGVPPIYDVYPNRTVAQSLNILRLNRILLCEDLLAPHTHANIEICSKATTTITAMIHEICASIPHMTDCSFAASSKLPPDAPCKHPTASQPTPHHTIAHVLDAYTLVFPLYILAWSRHCPPKIRTWALDHLTHIATHFGIRESGIVRDIVLNGHPGPQPEERRIEEIQPDEHQHENHPTNVSTLDTNASVKSGLGDQASLDTWYVYPSLASTPLYPFYV
jgi:hypothetical protein